MIPCLALAVACLAVSPGADRIVAADLAAAYPALASLDPVTFIAYAPAPGVSHVFHPDDLRLLAAHFHLLPATDLEICVERPVAPLNPATLLEVMRAALPETRIEIVEYSRQPAPAGEIEFPRAGLHGPQAGGSALWNGAVRYAGSRRFAIWARVRASVTVPRVLAMADLKPGRAIGAGQAMVQTREEFPVPGNFAAALDQVTGKWPRALIPSGAAIRTDQLQEPKEVERGETVLVEVFGGAAHLQFSGTAENAGAAGEMISVINPASHKRFRARVEGKGRVSVNSVKVTS